MERAIHKPSLHFGSIGNTLTVRVSVEMLDGQGRVALFKELGELLGIWKRFHEEPDATERAQKLIVEQWDIHWTK